MSDFSKHVVLDLFAGVGFGVAIRNLGARELGVDNAKAVLATRAANGMETVYEDVWDIHRARGLAFDTLVGGPPCPTFSSAGKGSGRKQMPLILQAIKDGLWRDMGALREWAETLEDVRSGLVLAPLAYIHEFRPDYIMLEQVKEVLPIWGAYCEVLRGMGYSADTRKMFTEQYGVPQTRIRAILIARKSHLGEVAFPAPTHSKYYSHDKTRLDPGVLPWVSMAEALEAATDGRTDGRTAPADESTEPDSHGRRREIRGLGAVPAERPQGDSRRTLVSNYTDGGTGGRGMRSESEPAFTITSKADRMKWEAA